MQKDEEILPVIEKKDEDVLKLNNKSEEEVLEELENFDVILDKDKFGISLYEKKITIFQKIEIESEMLYIEMFFALRDFAKYFLSLEKKYEIKIENFPKLILNLIFEDELENSQLEILKNFYSKV